MAFSAPEPGDDRTAAGEPDLTINPPDGDPAGAPRPLLAALGAGDAAVAAVARAFADAVGAATMTAVSTRETVQQRVADLPTELDELRGRFSGEELRRAVEVYRAQVERAYAAFAGRGEEAWGRLRERPRVTGERVARAGQRFTGRAADAVVDASAAAADAVEEVGTATAGRIEEAGDEVAAATRTAGRTASGDADPGRRTPRGRGGAADNPAGPQ